MRRNSSSSFGFAPGHPASMKCTPSQSSCSAIRSLSSTVSEIPSNCDPSRRVVSYISMLLTASLSVVIPVPTTRSYELAPVFVLVDLAANGLAVLGSDHLGHSTGTRDRTVVDRVHGADLGRGSAHEHLLGDVKVAARQVVDDDLKTVIPRDRRHRILRDAGQRAGRDRRRDQHAAPGDEDVLAGALRNETV